jgi:CHAD domain-containing protein
MGLKKDLPFEYKLYKKESLTSNFFRVVSGMNNTAISLCGFRTMKVADDHIHEIRKTMKKSRAILKLYRKATGEDFYIVENALFREVGKQLSELRMGTARLKTINKLKNQQKLKGNLRSFDPLIKDMKAHHMHKIREMVMEEKLQRSLAIILRDNRHMIKQLEDFPCDFMMLSAGLKRMYRRCVLNLNTAMNQPSTENVHNFRKPVKYLWNQLTLLRPIWPLAIGQMIRNLDRLGERLGDEHDLADLEQYLWSNHYTEASSIEPLIKAIRKERNRIQGNAWPLSMKMFAETPAAFAKRIHAYWDAW